MRAALIITVVAATVIGFIMTAPVWAVFIAVIYGFANQ